MKKLYYLLLLAFTLPLIANAQSASLGDETLNYVVQYKWGFVQKNGATAQITLRNNPNAYTIRVTAQTLPWADKLYPMRDTLTSNISKTTFKPINYTKITHENGKYRKDVIDYKYVGQHAYANVTRTKSYDGSTPVVTHQSFSATGPSYDMVSVFYFVRSLNFTKLTGGKVVIANIFSGSGVESLKIKNLGQQSVTLPTNHKTYQCYQLQLTFTKNGGTQSSAPMSVWVTTDPTHTPVKMVGTLSIGQVRCFLTSGFNPPQ